MAGNESFRDLFFEEAEDLLASLSDDLVRLNVGTPDNEIVHSIFRAVHSIKGSAGAFSLDELVGFAHRYETVLDEVRSDRLELSPDVFKVVQRSADHLAVLVEAARTEKSTDKTVTDAALAALDAFLDENVPDTANQSEGISEALESDNTLEAPLFEFPALTLDIEDLTPASPKSYDICFRPHPALYENGHEPAFLISHLAELGSLEAELDQSALPHWSSPEIVQPALSWNLRLATDTKREAIEEVFEFVDGLCDLTIDAKENDVPEQNTQDNAVSISEAATTTDLLEARPPLQTASIETAEPTSTTKAPDAPRPTLRVDLDRIERLFNAVGELIINQSMIAQRVDDLQLSHDADMAVHVESYRLLARDIQEAVMAIRAQPVKPLFQRMSRIVREAADDTEKQAQLVMIGEGTEVDKTVIERLADPLTHMIRNSVDHGLEAPEVRSANGKDPVGTIWLSAAHRSGSVVITIRDDGAGLDRDKVLGVAVKKGLVPADADLSETEIDNLIFMPGFSTASSTSLLSGRGVGLDVVRTAVQSLGGRVNIVSRPGKGTEFTIALPLTLAVLDGMLISVGNISMLVPISAVLETIRPMAGEVQPVGPNEQLLSIRGRFVPVIDLAANLGIARAIDADAPMLLLLVETEARGTCALLVDRVHDQRQVVIKGLESNYGHVPGVSAATVLGDGQIALILDPDAIVEQTHGAGQRAVSPT